MASSTTSSIVDYWVKRGRLKLGAGLLGLRSLARGQSRREKLQAAEEQAAARAAGWGDVEQEDDEVMALGDINVNVTERADPPPPPSKLGTLAKLVAVGLAVGTPIGAGLALGLPALLRPGHTVNVEVPSETRETTAPEPDRRGTFDLDLLPPEPAPETPTEG